MRSGVGYDAPHCFSFLVRPGSVPRLYGMQTETAPLPCFCSDGICAIHHGYAESHFIDPETGEVLDESPDGNYIDHDVHGTPFAGYDEEYGAWWGTDRALWVLSFGEHHVISGRIGYSDYIGHFLGTEAEVIEYCLTHGITITQVESYPV
jgi:hypothetical protein